MTQLKDLPPLGAVANTDLVHIQTDPAQIDSSASKLVLLQEIQAEVDLNTVKVSHPFNVLPQTGGGTLSAKRNNEIRDGSTYSLPLANAVLSGEIIVITLPDLYSSFTPLIQRTGTDSISYSGGTDTEYLFDAGSQEISLTSDGVGVWSL